MLVSTSLAIFAVFLDTTILFVAFPSIRADFSGVSASSLSWVLNAYTIVFAALLIPAGRLADRVGRRRTFLTAVVVFTLASMLCGLAPTAGLLVAARVLQAVGAAALVPSSLALVLQTFPSEKVPVAVAIWGAIGAVAGAFGPTLGALVVENLGWRWAFFINLPVGIVSFALGRRVLPEGREANPGRLPDPLGVVLLAAGLALLAFAIVKTDEWGWLSSTFVGTVAVSAVLIAVFFWRCSRVSNPLLDLSLFDSQSFRWANPAMLVYASRVQRDVPRQRAVPHRGVALLDLAGRHGDLDRSAHRRGHRAASSDAWPDVSVSARCWCRAGWSGRRGVSCSSRGLRPRADYSACTSLRSSSPHSESRCVAAAVVGGGAGLARRSVRLGFGGEPGGAQPGGDARRRARGGVHGRRDFRDSARRPSTGCGGSSSGADSS